MEKRAKFGIGIGIIVISMASLAWRGFGESKTYYHSLAELDTLKGSERAQRMRIGGTVQAGSIHAMTGRAGAGLDEGGETVAGSYVRREPWPDPFVDKSDALSE